MTTTDGPTLKIENTANPRRQTVLLDGTKIGTVEQVHDGWLALINGIPMGGARPSSANAVSVILAEMQSD